MWVLVGTDVKCVGVRVWVLVCVGMCECVIKNEGVCERECACVCVCVRDGVGVCKRWCWCV